MQITTAEKVYRTLSSMIVSLQLKPGDSFGEVQACEMLGTSRTPIREAFLRLSSEGLIESRGRAGTTIATISREAVSVAQFLRQSVELETVARASRSADRLLGLRTGQCLEEQRFAIEERDPGLFFRSDEKLHQEFCRAAGFPGAWPVIADAKKHMDRVRCLSLESTDFAELYQDHVDLTAAVQNGDEDAARRVLVIHLNRVMEQLDGLEARYPSYFSAGEMSPHDATREDHL